MRFGFYRLEHSYLSRAGNKYRGASKRGHLGAAANYYSNINKVSATLAINLPTNRRELMGELWGHDNSITRANGRVAETLILSFDKRMSLEHRKEAARRFMVEVTFGEQIKAVAFLHDNDAQNPHAHVIILDRDDEGRPVGHFGRSGSFRRENSPVKGNPTEWLRKTWEDSCNSVLEENEYDFRVSRRAALEREEEPVQTPQEEPMEKLTPREATIVASDFFTELRHVRDLQIKAVIFEDAVSSARRNLEVAEKEKTGAYGAVSAAEKALYTAEAKFEEYVKDNGKLRGFEIGIGRFSWKSPTRRDAEEAKAGFEAVQARLEAAQRTHQSTLAQVDRWQNSMETHQQELSSVTHQLETFRSQYGENATLDDAEQTLVHTAHAYMEGVSKEDLLDLYETNQISTWQYRDGLELLGETQLLNELEEKMIENLDERIESLDEGSQI